MENDNNFKDNIDLISLKGKKEWNKNEFEFQNENGNENLNLSENRVISSFSVMQNKFNNPPNLPLCENLETIKECTNGSMNTNKPQRKKSKINTRAEKAIIIHPKFRLLEGKYKNMNQCCLDKIAKDNHIVQEGKSSK